MSHRIDFQNCVILRSPLLPFDTAQDLQEDVLKELFRRPVVLEALLLASPDLIPPVQLWLHGNISSQKEKEKLLLTLRKYVLRMAFRCTPYGLFAGISRVKWGAATTLRLNAQSGYVRRSRLDMDYLSSVAVMLEQDPAVQEQLLYYPNKTLYRVGEQYRYVEYSLRDKVRHHGLVTIDGSEIVASILKQARGGQLLATLAASIVDPDITLEEARAFILELIESQILVSELEPAITGQDYLQQLVQVLRTRLYQHPVLTHLQWLDKHVSTLDKPILDNADELYGEIFNEVRRQGIAFEANHLLQVDMLKPLAENTLSHTVQTEASNVINLLHKLDNHWSNDVLLRFCSAFTDRYDQQEVPLLQALDTEMGIGYPVNNHEATDPAPLLHELPLGTSSSIDANLKWTAWQEFLFDKYLGVTKDNIKNVILTDEELTPFINENPKPLPTSLYCMGSLLSSSVQALDNGDFQLVFEMAAGPSAANLLARFCHLDEELTSDVRAILKQEEDQDADFIFAEIVHLNQSRIGNISTRPVLRSYEIPILVQAGVDEEHTLLLDDLMLSIRGEKLILRSIRLNRCVIPRLSSAHNFALHALPIYHFLCDLQFQNLTPSLGWNWGLLQRAKFLPRISYGKSVLSRAKWRLQKQEIARLIQAKEVDLLEVAKQLCQARELPAWVTIAEGDNKLPIKLDSLPHLQVLQTILKRKDTAVVEECLVQNDNLLLSGPEGGFTNEFIFPLSATPSATSSISLSTSRVRIPAQEQSPARAFSLGSEWLYIKLYCGLQTADRLLVEVILPLAQQLEHQRIIDAWFFIRYKDPHYHLRLRFHGTGTFYSQVIAALYDALRPYEQANLLAGLRTDVYQRELERYGNSIALSEVLFHRDSEATLRVLALLSGSEGDQIRWMLAIRSVDELLTDFGRSSEQKMQLMGRLQHAFKVELEATSATAKKAFGTKYRQTRLLIEQVLLPQLPDDHDLIPALTVLAERRHLWTPAINRILQHHAMGTLEVNLDDLIISHIHMLLNRFFRSKQRLHEAVIYDFMHQHYASSLARTAKAAKQ